MNANRLQVVRTPGISSARGHGTGMARHYTGMGHHDSGEAWATYDDVSVAPQSTASQCSDFVSEN